MTVDQSPPQADDPTPAPSPTGDDLDRERHDVAGVVGSRATRMVRLGLLLAVLVALGVWRGLPIVIVVVSILVMIFLHELGHFLAARWSGMKATEFFIGFGPRIWSFRRGETEYGIKAIPAGAYVRIIGMNNLEEVDPADEPRTYRQKPFRNRLAVAVAGSGMHFLIALVLLVVQFAFIGRPAENRWEVGDVTPASAAEAAGLQRGDALVSFDGRPVSDFESFRRRIGSSEPGPAEVVVERDGQRRTTTVDLSRRILVVGTIGEDLGLLDSGSGVRVGVVPPGTQAASAGLDEGDQVLRINDVAVEDLGDVGAALEDSLGGVFTVTTAGGTSGDAAEEEHRVDLGSQVAATDPATFLGVGQQSVLVTESLPGAVTESVTQFGRGVGISVVAIGKFLWPPNLLGFLSDAAAPARDATDVATPAASTPSPDAERPISIVGAVLVGSDLTAQSASNLVAFLISLNIFIGVFNLIPLLPFDGGHVAIAVYEKAQELRRRQRQRYVADVSRMLPVAYVVVMVLVVVGLVAMYLDVTRGVSI